VADKEDDEAAVLLDGPFAPMRLRMLKMLCCWIDRVSDVTEEEAYIHVPIGN
jgi:hypothetical protein